MPMQTYQTQPAHAEVRYGDRYGPSANVVGISGALRGSEQPILRRQFRRALDVARRRPTGCGPITFDFAGVTETDSPGVGVVIELAVEARRNGLSVRCEGLGAHWRNTLEAARLLQLAPLAESE